MLGHLFYPWGFILQALAIIHFIRRRPEGRALASLGVVSEGECVVEEIEAVAGDYTSGYLPPQPATSCCM